MGHKSTHRKLDAIKAKLEALCIDKASLLSTNEESSSSSSPTPPAKSTKLRTNGHKNKVGLSFTQFVLLFWNEY